VTTTQGPTKAIQCMFTDLRCTHQQASNCWHEDCETRDFSPGAAWCQQQQQFIIDRAGQSTTEYDINQRVTIV